MKRFVGISLCFLLIIVSAFCGCNGASEEQSDSVNEANTEKFGGTAYRDN